MGISFYVGAVSFSKNRHKKSHTATGSFGLIQTHTYAHTRFFCRFNSKKSEDLNKKKKK